MAVQNVVKTRMPQRLVRQLPASLIVRGNTNLAGRYDVRPFPRPRVFIAPGADQATDPSTWPWVEITADVRVGSGLSIKRGRSEGSTQAEPSSLRFSLNNAAGDYTPYLPTGRFYPYWRRSMPVQVLFDYGAGDVARGLCYLTDVRPGWDASLNVPTVEVEASGRLRRYGQGTPVAQSLIKAWNLVDPRPIAYWPLEDSSGSDTFEEVIGGASAMTWTNTEPAFASSGPPGSGSVVKLASDTELRADVAPYTSSGTWSLLWINYIPSAPASESVLATVRTVGTIAEWRVDLTTSGGTDTLTVQGYDTTGTLVINSSGNFAVTGASEPYAKWLAFRLKAVQNGANIDWTLTLSEKDTEETASLTGSYAATNGGVSNVFVSSSWTHPDYLYGHFALYDYAVTYPVDILGGYDQQTPVERITNALSYAGEPAGTYVGSTELQTLGPWVRGSLLDTLKDAEKADGGVLYEGVDGTVSYRSRYSRYNQTASLTLDMAQGQLGIPFAPVDDDQRLRNEWTISRSGGGAATFGSSATWLDSTHQDEHGRYADSDSINVDADDLLVHHAGWRVNVGTVRGMRYPRLSIDLARNPDLAAAWAGTDIGDLITVSNLPDQHPPGDVQVLLDGYTETVRANVWRVEANCSPALPWDVYVVGSSTRGRTPTGGSTLAAAIGTADTSLSVASSTANLWTTTATYPADFPISATVGGEDITIIAITSATSPQTFTVTRAVNGVVKTHQTGTAVQIKNPSPIAL